MPLGTAAANVHRSEYVEAMSAVALAHYGWTREDPCAGGGLPKGPTETVLVPAGRQTVAVRAVVAGGVPMHFRKLPGGACRDAHPRQSRSRRRSRFFVALDRLPQVTFVFHRSQEVPGLQISR